MMIARVLTAAGGGFEVEMPEVPEDATPAELAKTFVEQSQNMTIVQIGTAVFFIDKIIGVNFAQIPSTASGTDH